MVVDEAEDGGGRARSTPQRLVAKRVMGVLGWERDGWERSWVAMARPMPRFCRIG